MQNLYLHGAGAKGDGACTFSSYIAVGRKLFLCFLGGAHTNLYYLDNTARQSNNYKGEASSGLIVFRRSSDPERSQCQIAHTFLSFLLIN